MGKIKASLAGVSTEFKNLPPGLYNLEVEKVEEKTLKGDSSTVAAYIVTSKVLDEGDNHGEKLRDYITIVSKKGEVNEVGLQSLKRYFEVIYGIDEVSGPQDPLTKKRSGGWSDDEFDTDMLINKRWRGQITIESNTPEGSSEPKQYNKVKAMEPAA